jgi:multiple sugar transport system substrate-binding protein
MKVKVMVLMMILVMASALWAGGGSQSGASAGKTTLEFYSWLDEENYLTEVVNTYNALHPEVNVRLTVSPTTDYAQKIAITLSGGAVVDAICMNNPSQAATYSELGQLVDLNPYIKAANLDVSGISGFIDSFNNEVGAVYGLPYRKSVWVLFYNKKIFDDAGIPYPGDNLTWEQYSELAQRLTRGSGENKIFGVLNFGPTSAWWRAPANTTGANNPVVPGDLAEYKKAAQYTWDLSYKYQVQPLYADRVGTAAEDYAGIFMQGKHAMMVNGDWAVNMINTGISRGININYDVAAIPHWAGKEPYSTGTPSLGSVNVASKFKDEAFKFVSFLASNEGAKIISKYGMMPAWSSQEVMDIYLKELPNPKHGEVFFSQKVYSQAPFSTQYSRGQAIVNEEMSLFLLNEQEIDKTFSIIEQRIKDEVLNQR